MRTEPFQIFSLHLRGEISRQNPGFGSHELTAALSCLWRSLSREEKQTYFDLAVQATNERRTVRTRRPRRRLDDVSEQVSPELDQPEPSGHDEHVIFSEWPHFPIMARGSFGVLAAIASRQVVFTRQGPPEDLMDRGNPRLVE
jgi:hypothetical protein